MSEKNLYIHETALVENAEKIGDGTKVWHWCHISKGAKIGKNCSFGQNVYVANNVVIGDGTKVQNNVSIYDEVYLGPNVFCGPSMVFTNVINPRSGVNRKSEYLKTIVEEGVTFGANCTIVCGVTIGEYAFIAAGAVVNKSINPYELVAGVPAKKVGWMTQFGEKIVFDKNNEYVCEHTKKIYTLNDGKVQVI